MKTYFDTQHMRRLNDVQEVTQFNQKWIGYFYMIGAERIDTLESIDVFNQRVDDGVYTEA